MKYLLLAIVLPTGLLTGCHTTTQASRDGATATKQIVANFHDLEQKQLNDINNQYDKEFGKIMTEMTALTWKEADQGFDRESVLIADNLAKDWKFQTQPGAISGTMLTTVQTDYKKLRSAEAALDNLRQDYTDNYKKAAAQLDLLEQIETSLDAVSKTPSEWNDMQTTLAMFYKAYNDQPTNSVPAPAKK